MINPSIVGGLVDDISRLKGDGRVSGSVQAFGTFLADAQAPSRVVA
jgi:hypothetical protein